MKKKSDIINIQEKDNKEISYKNGEIENYNNNLTLYQRNDFLTAQKPYDLLAHRILRMAVAAVRPHLSKKFDYGDDEFYDIFISKKELREMCKETNPDKLSLKLDKAIKLFWKPIRVGDIHKFTDFVVFERIDWDEDKGLTLRFSHTMKDFLLQLESGHYTKTQLALAFKFSSTYSIILLDLMLQYQGRANNGVVIRDFTLEELYFSMNISEDKYKGRINNFRNSVIDKAIKEINAKTDYYISPKYEVLHGAYNRVTGFQFVMRLPGKSDATMEELALPHLKINIEQRHLKEQLRICGINEKIIDKLTNMPDALESYKVAAAYINRGEVKNKAAYIRKAIEENFFAQQQEIQAAKAAKKTTKAKLSNQPNIDNKPVTKANMEEVLDENQDNILGRLAAKHVKN